jgi:putative colanic acid biosynthesis acetyltransferase WcaF
MPLITKPIMIERRSWIATGAFVGPGVTISEGAILGAKSVTFKNLEKWTIYAGNPANIIKTRKQF